MLTSLGEADLKRPVTWVMSDQTSSLIFTELHMQRSYFFTHAVMMIFIFTGAVVSALGVARFATMSPVNLDAMAMLNGLILLGSGVSTLTFGLLGRILIHIAENTAISAEHLASLSGARSNIHPKQVNPKLNTASAPKIIPPLTR